MIKRRKKGGKNARKKRRNNGMKYTRKEGKEKVRNGDDYYTARRKIYEK